MECGQHKQRHFRTTQRNHVNVCLKKAVVCIPCINRRLKEKVRFGPILVQGFIKLRHLLNIS